MTLDKGALINALTTLFASAYKQNWTQDKVASELANAIDTYVRGADVTGVTVQVTDPATNKVIGNGTQTGTGKLN